MPRRPINAAASLLILALLGACATRPMGENYRPIVDLKGADTPRYESDLNDCQAYARQTAGATEQAATGALAGAIFGTLLAAAAGRGYSRNQHAAVGAVVGAAGGAVEGERDQRAIIVRCLSGRGYNVLK